MSSLTPFSHATKKTFMRFVSVKTAWLIILGVIPVLSIFGRPLQRMIVQKISWGELTVLFLAISIGLLGLLVLYVRKQEVNRKWVHLAWAAAVFIVIPLMLPTVAERLHFIVFGVFGYLSFRSWGLPRAILICLSIGLLDELLQWWLPDRYGDWRDVGFNWLACIAGCLLGYFFRSVHEVDYHTS